MVGMWTTEKDQVCYETEVTQGCVKHGRQLIVFKCNEKGFNRTDL